MPAGGSLEVNIRTKVAAYQAERRAAGGVPGSPAGYSVDFGQINQYLQKMADLMDKVWRRLMSPDFFKPLEDLFAKTFKPMQETLERIADTIGMGRVPGVIAPSITREAESVAAGIALQEAKRESILRILGDEEPVTQPGKYWKGPPGLEQWEPPGAPGGGKEGKLPGLLGRANEFLSNMSGTLLTLFILEKFLRWIYEGFASSAFFRGLGDIIGAAFKLLALPFAQAFWNLLAPLLTKLLLPFAEWWAAGGFKEITGKTLPMIPSTPGGYRYPLDDFIRIFNQLLEGIKEKFGELWEGLKVKFSEFISDFKSKVGTLWEGLKGKASEFFAKAGELWDGLKVKATDYFTKVGELWDVLEGKISDLMKGWGQPEPPPMPPEEVTKAAAKPDILDLFKEKLGKVTGEFKPGEAAAATAGQVGLIGLSELLTNYNIKVPGDWPGSKQMNQLLDIMRDVNKALTPGGKIVDGRLVSPYKEMGVNIPIPIPKSWMGGGDNLSTNATNVNASNVVVKSDKPQEPTNMTNTVNVYIDGKQMDQRYVTYDFFNRVVSTRGVT